MTPQEFVQKWRKILADERTATTRLGERKLYQQHFLDLCALAGHQTPGELDPKQTFFSFEADAAKAGGGRGWADVCGKRNRLRLTQ